MRSLSILFAIAAALGGCVDREVLHHEVSEDSSGLQPREGNFPEPATSACGSLPPGVEPIPDLAAAWIVTGASTSARRLRVTNAGLGCAEGFEWIGPSGSNQCDDSWSWWYGVTLHAEVDGPGIYELDELPALFPEIAMNDNACGGEVGGGGGPEPSDFVGAGAELEIFSMTETCIVGELRGVHFGVEHPVLALSGGFVAQRCETSCDSLERTGPDC